MLVTYLDLCIDWLVTYLESCIERRDCHYITSPIVYWDKGSTVGCVRFNLINHLVSFILYQICLYFSNSNPVYRWDSCKGSEWESVKKFSRLCNESRTHNWISRVACTCKPPNVEHVPSMPEVEASYQLEHYRAKSTDWPFSYLVAGTRDLVKLPASIVLKNLTLCISFLL